MRTIVLMLSLIALAVPAHAAPPKANDGVSIEKKCRDAVGKEQSEGEGRGHVGHLQAQRFSDCMMGMPN